jgi:hypothetical protein
MYINHLTLSTGNITRIERGDVDGETLGRVAPWLAALVASGESAALPVSDLDSYTALASVADGALIITISGPAMDSGPMRGKPPPLVTMGVAKRSRQGAALWPLLQAPHMPAVKRGAERPAEPWCGVAIWPTIMLHPKSMAWLADLERCIAWAWCTRAEDDSEGLST